jgi:hypothetical protein
MEGMMWGLNDFVYTGVFIIDNLGFFTGYR